MMKYYDIKFKFDTFLINEKQIEYCFKEIENSLNIQFDEKLNPYIVEGGKSHNFMDVSNQTSEAIETIINNFFSFTFESIIDVPLYKFLVLKTNDKLIVLANICSLIFDYNSINEICDLFDKSCNLENNFMQEYNALSNYLSSSEFEKDSVYWKNLLLDIGNYIKYYNIKSDNYQKQDIAFNNDSLNEFLSNHNISISNFISSVFSLYLSRIDNTQGSLLNTIINGKKSLIDIPYLKDNTFNEYLISFDEIYREAAEHTKADIGDYIENNVSFYSVYDFTSLNESVTVYNGQDDALSLNIYKNKLELIYNEELFSDVYIEHMLANLAYLISNILDSPEKLCGDIEILSGDEKDLISGLSKGKSLPVEYCKTLAMAFRDNAKNNPDAIAVDDGVNRVSFGDLEKSTNSIAYDLLNNHKIDSKNAIGLMLPRNYHYLEMMVALNKMGIPFIPIDPLYPINRIEHMLNIGQSDYVITSRSFEDLHDFNVNVLYIEDLNRNLDVSVDIIVNPDDLLAIFFTSGTTGLPKGVMVSNKQISVLSFSYKDIFKSAPGDVVGYFASFSFIASIRLIATLYYGECCRIFNETEQKDSLLLVKALKEYSMSDLILPPAVGVPIFENEDLKLKHLILTGAKLNEISKKERYTKLVNFYGATEIIMAITNIVDFDKVKGNRVPIGRPNPNTWIYILDENGMQLPVGVPGEICVSGESISPGYFNNPDLTKEVFVDNPYSDCKENKRMYCTGDIGFYNFDGEIEIIGRRDDQLSVRGFRIESGEILKVMKTFKSIGDIYLDVDNDTLFAYYTLNDDLDINIVKESLKNELPYYMIPSLFIELDEIPLNLNGKIDKSRLNKNTQKAVDVEISDKTLKIVLDAFKTVLNNDSVLIDDDFVEFGGNSLSAMHLQRILNDKLNVSLSSSEIVELATPINIANKIKFSLKTHYSYAVDYNFDDLCPLSESQLNVYLDESVKEMGTAYNNPVKIEFNKNYSVDEIKSAIDKLLEIYPVLTARVINDEGKISFSFDAEMDIGYGLLEDIGSFIKPFELDKQLSRFLIVENSGSNILCLDCHHLIFDGTSLNIMLNQLVSALENKNVDFVDNGVLRQISFEENLSHSYMDEAHEFFNIMLADRDECFGFLPSVKNGHNVDVSADVGVGVDVGADIDSGVAYLDIFNMDNNRLNSFLQNKHITPNQFFTCVFAYTLSRFTGSSKVLFNLLEDGRGHIDLSESVGMFVRTLPLLMDCSNQNISSFLEYSSDLVSSVMKYDMYPFRLLANEYGLSSDILFQYSHNLFYNAINKEEFGYCIDELEHDVLGDLSFFIFNVDENKMGIRILYSDKYSKEIIKRFADSFKLVLKEMMDVTELSEINYTSSRDLILLDSYNHTEHALKYDGILEAFNDNLSMYPDKNLILGDEINYTYAQSAYLVNQLNSVLNENNIYENDKIAVFVDRNHWVLIASLSLIAQGVTYIPIDENYPDSRIAYMIEQSFSKAIIVTDTFQSRVENIKKEFDLDLRIINISSLDDTVKEDFYVDYIEDSINEVACILYTSGTTGNPKAVEMTKLGIVALMEYYAYSTDFTSDDVQGIYASVGFDASLEEFVSVFIGGSVTYVPNDLKLDMKKLNDYFVKYGVTHTLITTQVGKLFVNSIDETSLKCLLVAGEKLGTVDLPNNYILSDVYGPTEANYITSIDVIDKID